MSLVAEQNVSRADQFRGVKALLLVASPVLILALMVLPYLGVIIGICLGLVVVVVPAIWAKLLLDAMHYEPGEETARHKAVVSTWAFALLGFFLVIGGIPLRVMAIDSGRESEELATQADRGSHLMYLLSLTTSGSPAAYPDSLPSFIHDCPAAIPLLLSGPSEKLSASGKTISEMADFIYTGYTVPATTGKKYIVITSRSDAFHGQRVIGWSNGNVEVLDSEAVKAARADDDKARAEGGIAGRGVGPG